MNVDSSFNLHAQSCPTLGDSLDCTLPGYSVHGIFSAKILKQVAISFSRGSSQPRNPICISCIPSGFLTAEPQGKSSPPPHAHVKNFKSQKAIKNVNSHSHFMTSFSEAKKVNLCWVFRENFRIQSSLGTHRQLFPELLLISISTSTADPYIKWKIICI